MTREPLDPADTPRLILDLERAERLRKYFKREGIDMADSVLVIAALHSVYMAQARSEGKKASPEIYADLYLQALRLYSPTILDVYPLLDDFLNKDQDPHDTTN